MNTKNILLKHIYRAKLDSDTCLSELLDLMNQAVVKTDAEDIDWHLMNDLSEADILLLITLTDVHLTINFNETVLNEVVQYVMELGSERLH